MNLFIKIQITSALSKSLPIYIVLKLYNFPRILYQPIYPSPDLLSFYLQPSNSLSIMKVFEEILAIFANLSFFISILACFYMFIKYCKLPHKTFGAKMIITLCIADFLFSSGLVLRSYIDFAPIRILGAVFGGVAFRFSVFWSSCIAILLYKLLASDDKVQGTKYYRYCLCIVISLSLFLAFV